MKGRVSLRDREFMGLIAETDASTRPLWQQVGEWLSYGQVSKGGSSWGEGACVECGAMMDACQQTLDLQDVRGVCEECCDLGCSGNQEPRFLASRHHFSRTSSRYIRHDRRYGDFGQATTDLFEQK
jgi:hypothetical protein